MSFILFHRCFWMCVCVSVCAIESSFLKCLIIEVASIHSYLNILPLFRSHAFVLLRIFYFFFFHAAFSFPRAIVAIGSCAQCGFVLHSLNFKYIRNLFFLSFSKALQLSFASQSHFSMAATRCWLHWMQLHNGFMPLCHQNLRLNSFIFCYGNTMYWRFSREYTAHICKEKIWTTRNTQEIMKRLFGI